MTRHSNSSKGCYVIRKREPEDSCATSSFLPRKKHVHQFKVAFPKKAKSDKMELMKVNSSTFLLFGIILSYTTKAAKLVRLNSQATLVGQDSTPMQAGQGFQYTVTNSAVTGCTFRRFAESCPANSARRLLSSFPSGAPGGPQPSPSQPSPSQPIEDTELGTRIYHCT